MSSAGAGKIPAEVTSITAWKLELTVAESVRDSQRSDAISEYAELLTELPSVVVFYDAGTDANYLAECRHTCATYVKVHGDDAELPCDLPDGDRDAALQYALKANIAHGIQDSLADRPAKVRAACKHLPGLSAREIAD